MIYMIKGLQGFYNHSIIVISGSDIFLSLYLPCIVYLLLFLILPSFSSFILHPFPRYFFPAVFMRMK